MVEPSWERPKRVSCDDSGLQARIRLYVKGAVLFNEGRFFESHELWEEAWKAADGLEKQFYHALIQTAAALHHAQRGNHKGATSLWAKARAKLDRLPSLYQHTDLASLRADVERFFSALGSLSTAPQTKMRPILKVTGFAIQASESSS